MAKNLRAKIPESDTLVICDANPESTKRFIAEQSGKRVEIASNPRELAEKSVSGESQSQCETIRIFAFSFLSKTIQRRWLGAKEAAWKYHCMSEG